MNVVFEFLCEHYQLVFGIVSLFISLIILIITIVKKGVNSSALVAVLLKLPELIREAEKDGGAGVNKYTKVFAVAVRMLVSLTKLSEKQVINKYGFLIDNSIEDILSAPTKKGK